MKQNSKLIRVMEIETIQKNEASPKSLMSRGNFLIMACFVFMAFFGGCQKEDDKDDEIDISTFETSWFDGTITFTMEDVTDSLQTNSLNTIALRSSPMESWYPLTKYFSYVSAFIWKNRLGSGFEGFEEIATGSLTDNGFSITLPSAPLTTYNIKDYFKRFYSEKRVKISDKKANILCIEWQGFEMVWIPDPFDNNPRTNVGERGRQIVYSNGKEATQDDDCVYAEFWYTDRDVAVDFSGSCGYGFHILLKRGWNVVYCTKIRCSEGFDWVSSTKAVSGLKWYY